VSVAATGASIVLWGTALWQRDGVARLAAAAGVMVGAVLALGIVSGSLHLNVRGIVLVAMLQGGWILVVVAYLLRARSPSSREEADGRSI
jgi:hypothetical protein